MKTALITGPIRFPIPQYVDSLSIWETPDVAAIVLNRELSGEIPAILPREMGNRLRVGLPLGTLGFPRIMGELDLAWIPLATFKDGILSSLRPFYIVGSSPSSFLSRSRILHYNLLTEPGTSGSPVFDHYGYVVAVNHGGIHYSIEDVEDNVLGTIPTSHTFGIHAEAMWELIDHAGASGSAASLSIAGHSESPSGPYQSFPDNWNGETVLP